jgi:hypothetical protein
MSTSEESRLGPGIMLRKVGSGRSRVQRVARHGGIDVYACKSGRGATVVDTMLWGCRGGRQSDLGWVSIDMGRGI